MRDDAFLTRIDDLCLTVRTGRVRRIMPTFLEADGPAVSLGALCEIEGANSPLMAEVVGINPDGVILAPLEQALGIVVGARVKAIGTGDVAPVGDRLLGRAVNALARPIDGQGELGPGPERSTRAGALEPLSRTTPRAPLETGLRTIDGLLSLAQGQRVGVFAASGVGKTSLMNQLARQVVADRCVICLVGERGREVEAMWSESLPAQVRARSVMVAATADQSAAMRVRAAEYALTLAEHWRDQGLHVLLLLDSVTRLAMALREVGLAAGEPPTVRAYTPGVFAAIPRLVERCGAVRDAGAITAIMTVLCETDEADDPIAELMKSLLDGHIVLSRALAEQGRYPAIDVPRSISRLAARVMSDNHRRNAEPALAALGAYDAARTLIETGVYAAGTDPDLDRAIALRPALLRFLKQGLDENIGFGATCLALDAIMREPGYVAA